MECQSARFGSQGRTGRWRVAHKCTCRHTTLHPPAALTKNEPANEALVLLSSPLYLPPLYLALVLGRPQ